MITKNKLPSSGQVAFGTVCALCLVLILCFSDTAIEYMRSGLELCARSVIPSLFPFMIVSELIVKSGCGEACGRLLERPIRWIFGISGISACPVLLGALCGFPIGAKTTIALLDDGYISKKEASRLLTFCNSPSSAFITGAVGVSLYSSKKTGIVLYLAVLGSALLIGVFGRLFSVKESENSVRPSRRKLPGIECFTSAVSSSASGMLVVCAYVVFFSAIVGCLGRFMTRFGVSGHLLALIYGLVEMSGGVSAASALGANMSSLTLCAFILGWSGLSVHLQVLSICSGRGLSPKPYIIAKLAQGLLSSAAVAIIYRISPDIFQLQKEDVHVSILCTEPICGVVCALFLISIGFLLSYAAHKSTNSVIY